MDTSAIEIQLREPLLEHDELQKSNKGDESEKSNKSDESEKSNKSDESEKSNRPGELENLNRGELENLSRGELENLNRRHEVEKSNKASTLTETVSRNTTGDDQKSKGTALTISRIIWGILSIILLIVTGVNKITLLSIADELQISLENFKDSTFRNNTSDFGDDNPDIYSRPITIYWQLLFVLLLPNFITLSLSLLFGCFGKTNKTFPWPNICAIIAGIIGAVAEVFFVCIFVYLVLASLSSGISILLLHGIFFIQTIICLIKVSYCIHYSKKPGSIESEEQNSVNKKKSWSFLIMFCVTLTFQVIGFICFMILQYYRFLKGNIMVFNINIGGILFGIPSALFIISIVWSNWYQRITITSVNNIPNNMCKLCMTLKGKSYNTSAHYKSSIINSITRLILYIFISYIIFRFASPFRIDPWRLGDSDHKIDVIGRTGLTVLLHILFSIFGYSLTWMICKIDKAKILAPVLILATPISMVAYYATIYGKKMSHPILYFSSPSEDTFELPSSDFALPFIGAITIFISGSLAMFFMICLSSDNINKHDRNIFLTPYFNSIFLEQQLILNLNLNDMNFKKEKEDNQTDSKMSRNIFICSTMYRESECEMKQLLTSIYDMVIYLSQEKKKSEDKYESHIFFDGALTGSQIGNFGLQLLSLLNKTLKIKIHNGKKIETPYGFKYSWIIEHKMRSENDSYKMPFAIHFKDKAKVKSKKRWSQVMYMNYIIKHRMRNEELENTFILTTDADIEFGSHSVEILLKHISSNHKLAAVCCRTHPMGNGPIYWYQIFDYAIGHWFQKPAEHVIGSVLCCPGCFSIYRCSALSKVIDVYATEITNANDFLIKDMGEDRWLCTLLIKKGYHLEYSSIAQNYTFCPSEFNELYKQRRRWIPSTIANLLTLIRKSKEITEANASISIVYVLYQALIALSTAISPATVILVVSAGLESFDIPPILTAVLLFIVSILYGVICIYSSSKTQLQVSKVLTFLFAILMALVVVGIIKETVDDVINTTHNFALRNNCSILNNNTTGGICSKSNIPSQHYLPININFIYVLVLSTTFITAAIMHFSEKSYLLHVIWFILALPSGYLLLLIYSAANICDQSWGTRELSNVDDEGILGWKKPIKKFLTVVSSCRCFSWCCGCENKKLGETFLADESKKLEEGNDSSIEESLTESDENDDNETDLEQVPIIHSKLKEECKQWLIGSKSEKFIPNFEENGYTTESFIAGMSEEDLKEIGIIEDGYRLRLLRVIKCVYCPPLYSPSSDEQCDVETWLNRLELGEYTELFQQKGYITKEDIALLKLLHEKSLREMGIKKRAHIQRLIKAIQLLSGSLVNEGDMDSEVKDWLKKHDCLEYQHQFTSHGYTSMTYLAGIKEKELQEIGVEKEGLRLRLQREAQKVPSLLIDIKIPDCVESWLETLKLEEYKEMFHNQGYKTMNDIESLKELTVEKLKAMGITKRAHLSRLNMALDYLANPSTEDNRKRMTKNDINELTTTKLKKEDKEEFTFWSNLINEKLKPVSEKFINVADLHKSLINLRNISLMILLIVNLIWIILLFTLRIKQLQNYNIDPRAFQLLYLAVYGIIILIQFVAMLLHQGISLLHYLCFAN